MKKTTKSYFENECEKLQKHITLFKKKYPEIMNNDYPDCLPRIFEKYIEVYAHAYCMDNKSERRKMAKMLFSLLGELKK